MLSSINYYEQWNKRKNTETLTSVGKTVVVGEYSVVVATLDGEQGWKHDLLSVSSFFINGMATISSASTGVEFIMETYNIEHRI